MRITENSGYGTIRDSINSSRTRLENLQTQGATLKKLNRPSDDPVGSAKVLEVRTDKMNNDQFQMNAKLASSFLSNTDHAIEDLVETVMRAKEIAIGQSSGASSTPESRIGVAEEVKQLFERAVSTGNRRIGERYLFGGYKTNTPPLNAEGDFQGDDGEIMIEIGREVYLGMNLPGIEVFNTQPKNSSDYQRIESQKPPIARTLASDGPEGKDGAPGEPVGVKPNVNLFQELKVLRVGLLTGDMNAIRGTLERFDDLQGQLVSMRAKIGSRMNGIDGTISAHERHNITNAQLTSQIEDADMSQVMSDLAKEETVFKSSLASAKHLVQPTLLDFLR